MSLDQATHDKLTAGTSSVYVIGDYDKNFVLRSGFFPITNYAVLEELREHHEELVAQHARLAELTRALHRKFKREDDARQAALDAAYRGAGEVEREDTTPEDERRALLAAADAHQIAAGRALLAFTEQALDKLRGPVPEGWEPYLAAQSLMTPPEGEAAKLLEEIAGEERELQAEIAEAQRVIAAAGEKLRGFVPLKAWIAKNGNGATGQFLPGKDLPTPPAHTAGTKPRDLGVPGWHVDQTYPDGHAEDRPIAESVADDAEEGFIEMSDPYHDELERNR